MKNKKLLLLKQYLILEVYLLVHQYSVDYTQPLEDGMFRVLLWQWPQDMQVLDLAYSVESQDLLTNQFHQIKSSFTNLKLSTLFQDTFMVMNSTATQESPKRSMLPKLKFPNKHGTTLSSEVLTSFHPLIFQPQLSILEFQIEFTELQSTALQLNLSQDISMMFQFQL